jgi:hypothetical protein
MPYPNFIRPCPRTCHIPLALLTGAHLPPPHPSRRVPECQGLRYADALRARGVRTRVLVFPEDTHALDKPQSEFEQWVNLAWWLKVHALGQPPSA